MLEKVPILGFNVAMFCFKNRYKGIFFGPLLFFAVLMASLPQIAIAGGFGVSPPEINNDRLVPGSRLETKIFLVQGAPDEDVDIKITVDSKNIKDWISFGEGREFTIPAGVQQYPLNVVINVPRDAPLDIYKAFIRINTDPTKAKEAGQVAISVGARVDVELIVGDDIVSSFLIKRVQILDIKENELPKVSVTIENTGNVPSGPEAISFDLFNKFGNVRLAFAEADILEEVPSFTTDNLTVSFPLDIKLAAGEYWATVRLHDDEGRTISETKSVFNVHEGGLLAGASSARIIIPIIIVLFAILLFIFFIFKRKTSSRSFKKRRRVS